MDNELPSKTAEAKAARLLSEAPCAWGLFLSSLKGRWEGRAVGRWEGRAGLASAVFGMQQIRFPEVNGVALPNPGDAV